MKTKVFYGEYTLSHWVDLLLSRQIELPEYQRLFVWKKDKVSALIADDFSVDALTEKLDWLYDNENEIECIGQRGYEIGTEVFNLNSYQTKIQEFLAKI